jgi:hypothetical protein
VANFKRLTRYTNGTITFTRANTQFLVLRQSLNLEPDSTDTLVTINQNQAGRPDMISQLAYGSPDLWWVILEFNGIKDPLSELKTNQILRIPTMERVTKAISNLGV